MIVSMSIENFRSFGDEATINLVASNRFQDHHENHAVPLPHSKERVLRSAIIYGANAAGKSNLMKAISLLKQLAIEPRTKGQRIERAPFRLSDRALQPTVLDLTFAYEGNCYRYGIAFDDKLILEEWLILVKGSREKRIFSRKSSGEDAVKIDIADAHLKNQKYAALAVVGGPGNQSFLSLLTNTIPRADCPKDVRNAISWFSRVLHVVVPDSRFVQMGVRIHKDEKFRSFVADFLRSASTGIDDLTTTRHALTEDELRHKVPPEMFDMIMNGVESTPNSTTVVATDDDSEMIIEQSGGNSIYKLVFQSIHKDSNGKPVEFPLSDESDGTIRLLHLVPALHNLQSEGAVYFVDEIDRSLHPSLVRAFMEFFFEHCGPDSQIIATTHETNLLDLRLLRRDEIWFVEKQANGASSIFSLDEFSVRKDFDIRKNYLDGRFGAVPSLGGLDRLSEAMEQ